MLIESEVYVTQDPGKSRLSKQETRKQAMLKRPVRAQEIISYARKFDIYVDQGGRHAVHLVAPNNQRQPVPVHGGGRTLSPGVRDTIFEFIHQNGVCRS